MEKGGLHFLWDSQNNKILLSEAGKELLRCVINFDSHLQESPGRTSGEVWNSDIYEESGYVRLFRKTLFATATRIRLRRGCTYFLECKNLTKYEVESLQLSLTAAISLMNRPIVRRANKSLYDDMLRTNNLIFEYLDELWPQHPKLYVLPVDIELNEDNRRHLEDIDSLDFSRKKWKKFPELYLQDLKRTSRFVKKFAAASNGNLAGYLIRIIQHPDGQPCCKLLFFLKRQGVNGASDTKQLLHLVWDDVVLGPIDRFGVKTGGAFGLSIETKNFQCVDNKATRQWEAFKNLVKSVFVEDLTYQRLRLPARRRSWGKGQIRSKS